MAHSKLRGLSVPEDDTITELRDEARAYEETLPAATRKALGQFFTGIKLGRLLAHLALANDTRAIFDPMAGSGDLLDAACEVANSRANVLQRLDAIEIDSQAAQICRRRLKAILTQEGTSLHVLSADAFDPKTYNNFPEDGYDLVIANPPYVRYQAMAGKGNKVRYGLRQIALQRLDGTVRRVWEALINGYSGLADLSVPAWLLCGLLVRSGGCLAIVAPATWRSRAYANVIRYLLLRCFSLDLVIEDTQPGWFSSALVRTQLIVAHRLSDDEIASSLIARKEWSDAHWIQVAPDAASPDSLVGSAFDDICPEGAFADWCRGGDTSCPVGVSSRQLSHEDEWASLRQESRKSEWLSVLEPEDSELPLFESMRSHIVPVPEALRSVTPQGFDSGVLRPLQEVGVQTGQGLRTGCNQFFYVHVVGEGRGGSVTVITNAAFGSKLLEVPATALRPVVHRQTDLEAWHSGAGLTTRVLDLRGWVMPEDFDIVCAAIPVYERTNEKPPKPMPEDLADYVRSAGSESLDAKSGSKPVSAYSAVRTNARPGRDNAPPKFWYMLPDFMPRHLPSAFVPRVVYDTPKVHRNIHPPVLIDANFSTFWSKLPEWPPIVLTAFLNSAWCRVVMEAVGTPLGGGALKLEAIHLRRMPVPALHPEALNKLEKELNLETSDRQQVLADRAILRILLPPKSSVLEIDNFAEVLRKRLGELRTARQRSLS